MKDGSFLSAVINATLAGSPQDSQIPNSHIENLLEDSGNYEVQNNESILNSSKVQFQDITPAMEAVTTPPLSQDDQNSKQSSNRKHALIRKENESHLTKIVS